MKVMSWDIEASSSHGDFPVPKKSYRKMIGEIIQYWTKNKKVISKKTPDEKKELVIKLVLAAFKYEKIDGMSRVYLKKRTNIPTKEEIIKKMNQIITPKNVEAMNQMIENTSEFTNKINNGVVKIINWQLLPGLEKSVGKLNLILQNMDALTQKINQNPAILIRGEVDADHEA